MKGFLIAKATPIHSKQHFAQQDRYEQHKRHHESAACLTHGVQSELARSDQLCCFEMLLAAKSLCLAKRISVAKNAHRQLA